MAASHEDSHEVSADESTLNSVEKRPRHLWWIGLLCALVYAAIAGFYSDSTLSDGRVMREMFNWLYVPALLYLYWHGYRTLQALRHPVAVMAGFGALFAVLAFLTQPYHSTDLYGYINRGWQQVGYGVNPYVLTVDDIPGWEHDPMFTDHWVNNPSPYGFLYIQVARFLTALGHGDFVRTIFIFKGFNVLVHALMALLVWWGACLARLKRPDLSLYLYAWNPLILLHALANGHNDLVMGLFVLLAGVAALANAWLWVLPALMAGTLVKYGAVVILPVAGLFLLRRKAWGALAGGLAISALLVVWIGWPYLQDWQSFQLGAIQENALVSHASLHSFLFATYRSILKLLPMASDPLWYEQAKVVGWTLLKNMLLGGYALFYAGLLWCVWRKQEPNGTNYVKSSLLVMSVLVCLASLKFYPWYLGMFFPLALLLEEGHWLRRVIVLISAMQLFSFTFIGQAHFLNFLLMLALPMVWVAWGARSKARGLRP